MCACHLLRCQWSLMLCMCLLLLACQCSLPLPPRPPRSYGVVVAYLLCVASAQYHSLQLRGVEIGGEITAGQPHFWHRFRTRGGAMVDYYSYLQSAVVEHAPYGLPSDLCDAIVQLTRHDHFPLSLLYRLYRFNQVRALAAVVACQRVSGGWR